MNRKINLSELSNALSARLGIDKQTATGLLRNFFDTIAEALEKDQLVKIKGFATFKTLVVEERESVSVNTGERISIGSHTKITFTPDPALKALVNRPFAQFKTITLNEETDLEEFNAIDEKFKTEDNSEEEPTTAHELEPETSPEAPDGPTSPRRPMPDTTEELPLGEESEPSKETEVPASAPEGKSGERPTPPPVPPHTGECPPKDILSHASLKEKEIEADESINPTNTYEEDIATDEKSRTETTEKKIPASHRPKMLRLTFPRILELLICGVFLFAAGFYLGTRTSIPCSHNSVKPDAAQDPTPQVAPQKKEEPPVSITADTIVPIGPAPANITEEKQPSTDAASPAALSNSTMTKPDPATQKLPQHPENDLLITGTKGYHTLKKGEDLTHLALHYYGSKDYVRYIIQYNELENPNIVHTGTKLKLPRLQVKRP